MIDGACILTFPIKEDVIAPYINTSEEQIFD